MKTAKEILREVAEKLPPEATLSDAIHELQFRLAVQKGLDEWDGGDGVPIQDVKGRISEWARR